MRIPSPFLGECFRPLVGYAKGLKSDGSVNYSYRQVPPGDPESRAYYAWADKVVPCGWCQACLHRRRREWVIRASHEARYHDKKCALCLTYSDEHLPSNGSLSRKDHVWFMRRLRDKLGVSPMYLGCGEYGEKLGRPHFHYVLFGHDFVDREYLRQSASDVEVFTSASLSSVWTKGEATVQDYEDSAAGYVAGYVFKKLAPYLRDNRDADTGLKPYQRFSLDGSIVDLVPEFQMASQRPVIGRKWFDEFNQDLDKGYLTWQGTKMPIPRLYLRWLEKFFPERHALIVERNKEFARAALEGDSSWERLADREAVAESFHSGMRARG